MTQYAVSWVVGDYKGFTKTWAFNPQGAEQSAYRSARREFGVTSQDVDIVYVKETA